VREARGESVQKYAQGVEAMSDTDSDGTERSKFYATVAAAPLPVVATMLYFGLPHWITATAAYYGGAVTGAVMTYSVTTGSEQNE